MSNLRDCQKASVFGFSFFLCSFFVVSSSNWIDISFSAFFVPMDSIKLSKNFTLFRESIKETLAAFKINKSIADMTREVF